MVNLNAILHTEKDFKRFMDVEKHVKKMMLCQIWCFDNCTERNREYEFLEY